MYKNWFCIESRTVHAKNVNKALVVLYGKGKIAPLYIGMVWVGQHHPHPFSKSAFLW